LLIGMMLVRLQPCQPSAHLHPFASSNGRTPGSHPGERGSDSPREHQPLQSSSGQDSGLSSREAEFDSPLEHHLGLAVDTLSLTSKYCTPAVNLLTLSPFTSRTGATPPMSSPRTTKPASNALLTQSRPQGWSVSRLSSGRAHRACGNSRAMSGATDVIDAGGTRMPR
jgi:hypothetical protein